MNPPNQSHESKLAAALAYLGPRWVYAPERRVTKQSHTNALKKWKEKQNGK